MLTPNDTLAITARRALNGHMGDDEGRAMKRNVEIEPMVANVSSRDFLNRAEDTNQRRLYAG